MKTVIVYNHPYDGSYCRAILQSVMQGLAQAHHQTDLIHLEADGFDPVMRAEDLLAFKNRKATDPQVLAYQQRLQAAEHLIFIFPIWWGLMPALTKGFIDKVMFPGVTYTYSGFRMLPLLRELRSVTVITTMNTPGIVYRLLTGNLIYRAMIRGVLAKTGYKKTKWINLSGVKMASGHSRQKRLKQLQNRFSKLK